jgi:ABC-type protease/lipase transport system fused ATPase/permease subunit
MAIATVVALGMVSSIVEFWGGRFSDSLRASDNVARSNAFYGRLSRMIRMVLQLAVLGVGAYLVLLEEMTAGMIFAASIISGRALQPLDQIVGSWRQVIEASQAWKRISALAKLDSVEKPASVELPAPKGALALEQVVYFRPRQGIILIMRADKSPPTLTRSVPGASRLSTSVKLPGTGFLRAVCISSDCVGSCQYGQ